MPLSAFIALQHFLMNSLHGSEQHQIPTTTTTIIIIIMVVAGKVTSYVAENKRAHMREGCAGSTIEKPAILINCFRN